MRQLWRLRAGLVAASVAVAILAINATSVMAHLGHSHTDGRIPGQPDFQRTGVSEFQFHPRVGAYTYKAGPNEPPQWVHLDDFAAGWGAFYELPSQEYPIVCATSGHRIKVAYSSTANPAIPTTAEKDAILSIVRRMNYKIAEESIRSSGSGRILRMMRVDCDTNGQIRLHTFTSPSGSVSDVFEAAKTALGAPTQQDSVKNLIFFDGNDPGGAAGYGGVFDDPLKASSDGVKGNLNRIFTTSAVIYNPGGFDPLGYWNDHATLHELFHTMGAVQPTAPFGTERFHCTDGIDVLCYPDGSAQSGKYSETRCPENGYFNTPNGTPLDCEYDSYFDTLEESGEWLNTHWNVGGVENPFLITPEYQLTDALTGWPSHYAFNLSGKQSTDIPVSGDWNGDGYDTTGYYRPSTATWYLRNSNFSGSIDIVAQFGEPNDRPVTGDWNEDGTDTIGVYRPSNGVFYLRNFNSTGGSQYAFAYGNSEDLPVAGDWNNSGTDTIGLYRPSTGVFFLSNTNATVPPDYSFAYGNPGNDDLPVAGDWDENGYDSVGVYRQSNGTWYLDNEVPGNQPISYVHGFGVLSHTIPIAGDWNKSGTDTAGAVWK